MRLPVPARRSSLLVLALVMACTPKRVEQAAPSATAMTVAQLQQAVARGPFPDDPCQAIWFYAVAGTNKAGEVMDAMMTRPSSCASELARVRLVSLARSNQLSWAVESRAEDLATRLELARFAALAKWDPGTSAVSDLVLDADESVRVAAIIAVRSLRASIATGQLERSLASKPQRWPDERSQLCTALTEFGADAPAAQCRGLSLVPLPPKPEPPGRPPPNLCRSLITNAQSPEPGTQLRAILELASPWVRHREGCVVPPELALRLVQFAPEANRAAAAMLTLWMNHPPDMRRAPTWPTTNITPDGVRSAP